MRNKMKLHSTSRCGKYLYFNIVEGRQNNLIFEHMKDIFYGVAFKDDITLVTVIIREYSYHYASLQANIKCHMGKIINLRRQAAVARSV
jgi:hypothetical protein